LYSELRELKSDAEHLDKQRQQESILLACNSKYKILFYLQANASLKALQRSLQLLTQELEIKTQSLMIDEVQCMTQRLSMNFHSY